MRIDGLVTTAVNTYNNGSDIMSKLKPGDNIRAQILDNSGSELTLKFSDGSIVTAAAASTVEAAEGEFVNLTYRGTVDERPAFEAAEKTVQPQVDKNLENIRNTLTSLKLPVTEHNMQLATALTEQNVPVTAESMAKMSELLSKNPELKPNAAAFLTAANLPADQNNINKLQSLLAGRLKLGNDITELVKLINTQGNGKESAVNPAEINKLVEKLVTQLATKGVISYEADAEGMNTTAGRVNTDTGTANKGGNPAVPVNNGSSVEASDPADITAATAGKISNNGISAETRNIANTANASTNAASSANTANSTNNSTSSPANGTANLEDSTAKLTNASELSGRSQTGENTGSKVNSTVTDMEKVINLVKGQAIPGKADLPLLNSVSKY